MQQEIENLEKQLRLLKAAYERHEADNYKNSAHNHFEPGDIVQNGDKIGIVGWTENHHMNLEYKDGYMGVDILTGARGFAAGVRRDDWKKVTDPFFTDTHEIRVQLTGVEIMLLKYALGPVNYNPNEAKTKLYTEIDRLQATEGKQEGGGQ